MFYTREDAKRELAKEAQALRSAASNICRIKKVVSAYNGKVYNCRFDEAIKQLCNDKMRIYSNVNYYGYFVLDFYDKEINKSVNLIYTKKATKDSETKLFTSAKRIKADCFINELNEKYSELLQRATEIERASAEIERTLEQLKSLKKSINCIISGLPSEVTNIYNLKHIY
jgi:hypothetical protein